MVRKKLLIRQTATNIISGLLLVALFFGVSWAVSFLVLPLFISSDEVKNNIWDWMSGIVSLLGGLTFIVYHLSQKENVANVRYSIFTHARYATWLRNVFLCIAVIIFIIGFLAFVNDDPKIDYLDWANAIVLFSATALGSLYILILRN